MVHNSYAIGEALGGLGQEFLDQYAENRDSQNTEAINSDPVATLIVALMKDRVEWEGRVSDLLTKLTDLAATHGINPRSKAFPAQPNALSRRLRGMKSNLEAVGIVFERRETMAGTTVSLSMAKIPPLPPYRHKPSDSNALRHGDTMAIYGDNENTTIISPCPNPLRHNDYGDNGDYGDKMAVSGGGSRVRRL